MEVEKKLIILVDDNTANLRIGKNVLAEKYTVATAPSADKLSNDWDGVFNFTEK